MSDRDAAAARQLAGKTVLVTGGSRGIGAATAREVHRQGAHVVVHYGRNAETAQALVAELGGRATAVGGDLATDEGPADVWRRALEATGVVDVLVNNAGAWLPSAIDSDAGWQEGWDRNLALNLRAPAELCRLAVLHFRERGGGIIVNVTSRSAHRGDDAEHLAYGAAKGGLLALTKGIARGYGRDGVLAYAVAPGWVATELADGAVDEALLAGLPLGEVTPPDDVAAVIAFLASGASRHTTGATIDITGADYVR
ncbi:SDR family oxidoreductase [Agromyces endophyticus]|uniref:SDR family NAD(P)-dependent oxidoreductase n=1 Tax=Agromyces sp. H17E-10 TaxID=2932244 RepID=UPI001FCF83B5|nr:SDR family oxidoreductase [Agromyces sp. H17E-10]UOQ90521.1 SDR family oxidoreductase [Agromyces sp. H17E-10]